MKKSPLLSIICMSMLAAGCGHYSTKLAQLENTEPAPALISPAAGGEESFGQYLKNNYLELARYEENTTKDYQAAQYYMKKIETLEQGHLVSPANMNDFEIGAEDKPEIVQAYATLSESLYIDRVPENRAVLAKAQTRFDCWVDQAEEKKLGKQIFFKDCRGEFYQAMDNVVNADYSEEEFYDDLFDVTL